MSGVDVLAVMDEYVESCAHCDGKGQLPVGEPYCDNGPTIDLEPCAECAEIRHARAAVADLFEAVQALPTPRGAQVITFEGADYVLLAPEDHEALCNALGRGTAESK